MTVPPAVTTLIAARRIEQVPADRASALVRLARRRNKAEYDDIAIGLAELTPDLGHAEAIIVAVRTAL